MPRCRQPVPQSLAYLLVAILLVAGCGGGDDDADDSSTPTATHTEVATLPTVEPVASPTRAAPTATSADASLQTTGTPGSDIGSGGQAPKPTSNAASPTATERPRNVSTTPRPIATRPPQPTIAITQPTPTAESGSDLVTVYDDNFDDGDAGTLYTGTTEGGASVGVVDGAYVTTVPPGFWQSFTIGDTTGVTNGVMWGTVTMVGTGGAAGLIARQYDTEDGGYWLLVCWISSDGAAGCDEISSNEFTNILRVEPGTLALQPTNLLVLSIVDSGVYFEVNQQEVGSATVSDLSPGQWGVYLETYEGAENTVYFDDMTVWATGS